ncbi:MAG: cupin [Acidobacteria bacterium]|nr:MAG: cupin [Acidobacteriota bacterium]
MARSSERGDDVARRRTLAVLAVLGGAAAGWAVFLWFQLLRARSGLEPFCAFGADDCARLWDGAFAGAVHRVSGVPVAGWGVAWGVAALVLPLLARRQGGGQGLFRHAEGAVRLVGLAGLAGVAALLAASTWEGGFCSNCALTYVLTVAYGALALGRLKASPWTEHGVFAATLVTVASYALLLYPGLRTPRGDAGSAGQRAVAEAAQTLPPPPAPGTPAPGTPGATATTEEELRRFLDTLPPELKQILSDVLEQFRRQPVLPPEPPRAPIGNPSAGVLITEFTDVKCSHCADLHQTMAYILNALPGRFALDARHYPLDGACNPRLPARGPETVRCLAARVQICAEGDPRRFELSGELFAHQRELDERLTYAIAAKYLPQMALDACLADPATEAKLQADVEYAGRYDPRGTPLVLVNGRQASPYGPFLFAIILTGGDPDHPAFADLPPPRTGG